MAFFTLPTNMVSPTMQFCCTYSNVADLLLYLVEVGGRLLRSGILWKSLCIWPPAPGLFAFFTLPTNVVSPTMQFYCSYTNVADLYYYTKWRWGAGSWSLAYCGNPCVSGRQLPASWHSSCCQQIWSLPPCSSANVADLLLPSGGGGQALEAGVLWKSLCIWPPAPGLLTFFMLPTNMVSPTMQFC